MVPVAEGGGLCGRENMRTLCVLCHADASAQQAGRRARVPREPSGGADAEAEAELRRWEEEGDEDFEGSKATKAKLKHKSKKAKSGAGAAK